MYIWLKDVLPKVLGLDVINSSTLLHVDFHPDTASIYGNALGERKIVLEINPITYIRSEHLVKNIWWVKDEKSEADPHLDLSFFE